MRRSPFPNATQIASLLILGSIIVPLSACSKASEAEPPTDQQQQTSVDVAIATLSQPSPGTEYIGTTAPIREVSIQAQTQGQLLALNVEVGDRIQQGQVLAQLDDDVLTASVNQARAEREAQIAEVASGERRVFEAKTRVKQAKVDLAQAKSDILRLRTSLQAQIESARLEVEQTERDAERLTRLLESGVTTQQEAEQAQTLAKQAKQTLLDQQSSAKQQLEQATTTFQSREQLLNAALEQVAIERKTAEADTRRTQAQQSLFEQAATQQSFSTVKAPITGVIMERQTEAGTFLQTGQELLTIGDFSQIKVLAQLSEQLLGKLSIGQSIQIRLDAFQNRTFQGKLTRISPLADATSRLIPVEIVMDNPSDRLGAGLLARISLQGNSHPILTVPETALQKELKPPNSPQKRTGFSAQNQKTSELQPGDQAYIFIASRGDHPIVRARQVTLGDRHNGQVEIRSGLSPKERYITRSSRPLQDGMNVQVSAISQKKES